MIVQIPTRLNLEVQEIRKRYTDLMQRIPPDATLEETLDYLHEVTHGLILEGYLDDPDA